MCVRKGGGAGKGHVRGSPSGYKKEVTASPGPWPTKACASPPTRKHTPH